MQITLSKPDKFLILATPVTFTNQVDYQTLFLSTNNNLQRTVLPVVIDYAQKQKNFLNPAVASRDQGNHMFHSAVLPKNNQANPQSSGADLKIQSQISFGQPTQQATLAHGYLEPRLGADPNQYHFQSQINDASEPLFMSQQK